MAEDYKGCRRNIAPEARQLLLCISITLYMTDGLKKLHLSPTKRNHVSISMTEVGTDNLYQLIASDSSAACSEDYNTAQYYSV